MGLLSGLVKLSIAKRIWAAPTLRATAQVSIHNPMADVIANLRCVP